MVKKHLVAVYGSLRNGLHNHRLLQGQKFRGLDVITGFQLHKYCSFFPAIAETEEDSEVTVEVYEVDDVCFARLDQLEGYPNFYNRKQVQTVKGITVWTYYIEGELDQEVIPHGDWVRFLKVPVVPPLINIS